MKLKIIGLLFLLLGFETPFFLRAIFPNFLYASALSSIWFWTGFLLILNPLGYKDNSRPYLWASYAILLNIVITILFGIFFYIVVVKLDIQRGFGGYTAIYYLSFVVNPVRSVFDILVAQPSIQQPDGSVIVTYSFIRSLLTFFFNLVFYSSMGVLIIIFKDKKITKKFR